MLGPGIFLSKSAHHPRLQPRRHISFSNMPSDQQRQISFDEVQKHKSSDDCWLVIKVSHTTNPMIHSQTS